MPSAPALEPVEIDHCVTFEVPPGWDFQRKLGSGAYGHVASFKHGEGAFAVKKVATSIRHQCEARRRLREIKIMQGLDHPTILGILDLWPGSGDDFSDVYIVTPLMDTDLHKILHVQNMKLTQNLLKILTYQLLQGVLVLQFAGVIHRDLKPSNLLVDVRGRLKIGDLGLSRGISDDEDVNLTQYVVTRWYRGPEIVLTAGCYTKAIDTWSVGCIVFEMLTNTVLFMGKDYLDQVRLILSVVGTPKDEELQWLTEEAREFVLQFERYPQRSVGCRDLAKDTDKQAVDLIDSALKFNPEHRADVTDMVKHPYLLSLYHPSHVDECREASCGKEGWIDAEYALQGADWSSAWRSIIMHDHKKFQRRKARKSAQNHKAVDGHDSHSTGSTIGPERQAKGANTRRADADVRLPKEEDALRRSGAGARTESRRHG
jgi:mitogen-activated protein kinase 1/3